MVRKYKPVKELIANPKIPGITVDAIKAMKEAMKRREFELEDDEVKE